MRLRCVLCQTFCQILNDVAVGAEEWFVLGNWVFRRDQLVSYGAISLENNLYVHIILKIFKFVRFENEFTLFLCKLLGPVAPPP